jgi:alanine racemase
MLTTACASIDLSALRDNLTVVRNLCPQSRVMAMVKADGYGHGLLPVSKALSAADGLAVARLQEALLLRSSGIEQRILLLGTLLDEADLVVCSKHHIDVTACDDRSVRLIAELAHARPLRVWLKLDSGMHRLGLQPDAFAEADRLLSGHSGVLELIHMTHLGSAGDRSAIMERQLSCLYACRKTCSKAKLSIANSAALITRPETRADWVRPGIMLYGESPVGEHLNLPLRAAMTLRSRIIGVREIEMGESVGYGARWTSTRRSRIGTIGIGYGDGYPRHAPNGTPVWIAGRLASVVGQVSMDSLTVDLTDCGNVAVGDEVILWGPQLSAATIAACANTISYDLFTSLQNRVTREFTDDAR